MANVYAYAFFALPLSFLGIPLYIYLPEFYSSTFGIPLTTIGIVILATRIFDSITDPICGYISDRFISNRKAIICVSAFILGVCFYLLFNPVIESKTLNLVFFSIVTYLFFSLLTINHLAFISAFENKVFVSSLREGFTVLGLLLATVLPSLLMLKYSSLTTFKVIGILVLILLIFCSIVFFIIINTQEISKNSNFNLQCLKNSTLWKYFALLLLNGMAIATPSTLVIFYIKNVLLLEKYTGFFLGMYFISAILFIPFWKKICEKFGTIKLFKVGMLGSVLTFFLCYFVTGGDFVFYSLICLFSGIFFGVDLIAPTLITNSIIERKRLESERVLVFGITHFISKVSVAIISGILLITLGFKTGEDYVKSVHLFYTILPCTFKVLALSIFHLMKDL